MNNNNDSVHLSHKREDTLHKSRSGQLISGFLYIIMALLILTDLLFKWSAAEPTIEIVILCVLLVPLFMVVGVVAIVKGFRKTYDASPTPEA